VYLALVSGHLSRQALRNILAFSLEPGNSVLDDNLGILVADLAIIHVETYRQLTAVDHFVGNAVVVEIEDKACSQNAGNKLVVIQLSGSLCAAIKRILVFSNELILSLSVLSRKGLVDVRYDLKKKECFP
jgi:hypothetical protein